MDRKKHKRNIFSIKNELLKKSSEAVLAAVQIYNNPLITFKSETFIVLMIIGWRNLLHAYYRELGVDYRYYEKRGKRKKYTNVAGKAHRYWDLEKCLNAIESPLDTPTKANLQLLLEIRHKIEHHMTEQIDEYLAPKLFACCFNFNEEISKLFGVKYSMGNKLSLAIQFSSFEPFQIEKMKTDKFSKTPLGKFLNNFTDNMKEEDRKSNKFHYSVLMIPQIASKENQSNRVVKFIKPTSEQLNEINQIFIKTQNTLDIYTLSTEMIVSKIKQDYPNVKKNRILTELKKLKGQKDYHTYSFSNPKWKKHFEQTKELKGYTNVYTENAFIKIKDMVGKL